MATIWPLAIRRNPGFLKRSSPSNAVTGVCKGDCSAHMYSDNATYIAWGREVIGWPLKEGNINMTSPWKPHQLEAGVEIAGNLERFGGRLMSAKIELKEPRPSQAVPLPNWFSHKLIPSVDGSEPDVNQLILAGPSRMDIGPVWEASGSLELYQGPADELHFLRPGEIVTADYAPFVDLTVGHGKVLARL